MIELIKGNLDKIAALCRRFGVGRLEVFGSAAHGSFDPIRSDVDFLVEFLPGQAMGPWLGNYFDFKAALEELLNRRVDLVMPRAMKNPYFIAEVNRSRTQVYAA
ncbi:MAG: DNA polymerase III subunit beta [Phycisphaerales bacterium]|nr:DNA polymerase III subunit beta [Phycisphaerales bacterium]